MTSDVTWILIRRTLWVTRWPFLVIVLWLVTADWFFHNRFPLTFHAFAILLIECTLVDFLGSCGVFTLSLPVSRRNMLLTQLGVVSAEISVLALGSCLLLTAAPPFRELAVSPVGRVLLGEASHTLPLGDVLSLSLDLAAVAVFVASLTAMLTVALGRHRAMALFLLLAVCGVAPILSWVQGDNRWIFSGGLSVFLGPIAWRRIFVILALAALCTWNSVLALERRDL